MGRPKQSSASFLGFPLWAWGFVLLSTGIFLGGVFENFSSDSSKLGRAKRRRNEAVPPPTPPKGPEASEKTQKPVDKVALLARAVEVFQLAQAAEKLDYDDEGQIRQLLQNLRAFETSLPQEASPSPADEEFRDIVSGIADSLAVVRGTMLKKLELDSLLPDDLVEQLKKVTGVDSVRRVMRGSHR